MTTVPETAEQGAGVDLPADGMSLQSRVLDDLELGVSPRQLLDPGHDYVEVDAQLSEDLLALQRSGCQNDVQSSGNQMPISRSADSSESEPWTMLKVTSSA